MRLVFVIPPPASPSSPSLGVASLVAEARRAGDVDLWVEDLNLAVWYSKMSPETVSFFRDPNGGFFDASSYRQKKREWDEASIHANSLSMDAKRELETGVFDSGVLDILTGLILRHDPEAVGFSMSYLAQVAPAMAIARRVRQALPRCQLFAGGSALSALEVENLLEACPWLDGVLAGEGEEAICQWVRGCELRLLPGVQSRNGRTSTRVQPPDLENLRKPDFGDFDLSAYLCPEIVLPLASSRSCRWNRCGFCAHNHSFGRYRTQTMDRLAQIMTEFKDLHGCRHYYLTDQYLPFEQMHELAECLPDGFRIHAMGRTEKVPDAEFFQKLFRGGFRWISWGVESVSQRLLDLCHKGTRVEDVEACLRQASAAGISNLAMMLYGLPTSSELDLEQTLLALESLDGSYDALTSSSLVLFKDTPFARQSHKYGFDITGVETLIETSPPIRSHRFNHRELAENGGYRPSRGPLEIAELNRRRRWWSDLSFMESLPTEHYLLHASRRFELPKLVAPLPA